jgi:hypothetical protein
LACAYDDFAVDSAPPAPRFLGEYRGSTGKSRQKNDLKVSEKFEDVLKKSELGAPG